MFEQLDLFEESEHPFKITKPIRLIEFFAGVGFQRMGIERTFPNAKSWRTTEWAVPSILAYDVAHNGNVATSTIEDKDFLVNELFNLGISVNYNDPASLSQIQHMPLEKLQRIYAAIERNNNLVNIMNVKGIDLNLVDYEDYTYVLTYSFPCQDLSLAGSGNGYETSQAENENQQLDSGVGTRSGLVWEVIRILKECKELGTLPHILVMENVTQVHGLGNVKEWHKLLNELSSLGYANFWKDMNGKNYGIPQNRDRTFMISILDKDAVYHFPKKVKLKLCLGDLLEKNVDEKYFLSKETVDRISSWKSYENPLTKVIGTESIMPTITTRIAESQDGGMNASMKLIDPESRIDKRLLETIQRNKIEKNDFIDTYNKVTRKDVAGTITTRVNEANKTFVATEQENLKQQLCNELIEKNLVKEGDCVNHSYSNSRMDKPTIANNDSPGCSPTLTTRPDTLGVVVKCGNYSPSGHNASSIVDPNGLAPTVMENHGTVTAIAIKNATQQGYLLAEEGDGIDISSRMESHRGTVQKGIAQTLTTQAGKDTGVCVKDETMFTETEKQLFTEDGNVKRYIDSDIVDEFKEGQMATTTYPNGYGHGPRTHDESIALNTVDKPVVKQNLRIRKLTPLECWRLMGADDMFFYRLRDIGGLTDAQIYHIAGDGLIVNIPQMLFETMKGE